jgi:hypothetical protein
MKNRRIKLYFFLLLAAVSGAACQTKRVEADTAPPYVASQKSQPAPLVEENAGNVIQEKVEELEHTVALQQRELARLRQRQIQDQYVAESNASPPPPPENVSANCSPAPATSIIAANEFTEPVPRRPEPIAIDSALLIAAAGGHRDEVKRLLNIGANVNVQDRAGRTPLHYASISGHDDTASYLLERGANPLISDDEGDIALTFAQKGGHNTTAKKIRKWM